MIQGTKTYSILRETLEDYDAPFIPVIYGKSYFFYLSSKDPHYLEILRGWYSYLINRLEIELDEFIIINIRAHIRQTKKERMQ